MKPALCVLLLVSAVVVRGDGTPQVASFNPLKDSLAQETPQPIYSRDPADPWNQAFFQLFTRTVQARLLPGSVTPFQLMAPESQHLLRTGAPVTRIESGDRAIDPLYSSWIWMGSNQFDMSSSGAWGVLNEPRYSQLLAALSAVASTASRADPLRRALMQADLWAAYDVLHAYTGGPRRALRPDDAARQERTTALLGRLAAAIRALALTRAEIAALPDTLGDAARHGVVPDLSDTRSGWIEARWSRNRMHEGAVHDRRAARVFLKPKTGEDAASLLGRLRDAQGSDLDSVVAAALVMEVLLVAEDGTVVRSPLAFDVQIRQPGARPAGRFAQFELNRQQLLAAPRAGGLTRRGEDDPAYLAIAGNDFSFATRPRMDAEAIVVPLRERCAACHGPDGRHLVTFSMTFGSEPPPVERLNPADDLQAREVAERKMRRDDYKSLVAVWRR